jgi:hypothetical protein
MPETFGRDDVLQRFILALLLAVNSVLYCVSLAWLAPFDEYHILYDGARLSAAMLAVVPFSLASLLFVVAEFSFGYVVGFHVYLMILGYLWLGTFSDLPYDHATAEISAAISAIAFLLPAVLIRAPIPQVFALSKSAFEKLPTAILLLATAVIAAGATYSFKIVPLSEIYSYREELGLPTALNYLIGITSSALLPFACACFVMRGAWLRAAASLILLFLFYPITLSKVAFFAPLWLVFVAVLSKILGSRITVILSLGLPLLFGIVLMMFFPEHAFPYSHIVNLRMFAIPSNAMDLYNDFFAHHDHTYFCQISFLKRALACPYREPLSVVMQQTYRLGYLNASLFATEGIASVGVLFAPIAALVCGLIVALANGLSAGLPSRFILISSALLPLILSNVPLTTVLLTHGAAALFLLWYLVPRDFSSSTSLR